MIFVHYGENLPLFLCIMEKIIFSVLHKNKNEFLVYPIIEICRKLCYNKDIKEIITLIDRLREKECTQ